VILNLNFLFLMIGGVLVFFRPNLSFCLLKETVDLTKIPKYNSTFIPLSQERSYFKKKDAPNFWALIPYYIPQHNERSSSLASVAMIINAARVNQKLMAADELVTEIELQKKVDDAIWNYGLGPIGKGVRLDQIKQLIEKGLKAYGIDKFTITINHIEDLTPKTFKLVHQDLVNLEKTSNSLIIANFDQKIFTGDTEIGQWAPVGAYDSFKKRVLILDPDRKHYEPYWINEETFLKAMATKDTAAKGAYRGYVKIDLTK
jgi:hypothetical protein